MSVVVFPVRIKLSQRSFHFCRNTKRDDVLALHPFIYKRNKVAGWFQRFHTTKNLATLNVLLIGTGMHRLSNREGEYNV